MTLLNRGVYTSASDMWATPQSLFDLLNEEFKFELDVCAIKENAKCERFYSPEDNGLSQTWQGVCWMNPPYGRNVGTWVKKAKQSAEENGATVVCLLPARTDPTWWWETSIFGEVRFIRGRLRFNGGTSNAPFPSAIVIFSPNIEPSVKWWDAYKR